MLRPDGLLGELVLVGRARDLWTDADGAAHVLGEASYEARVAFIGERRILAMRSEPERADLQRVAGTRASGGFRAALDEALPAERDARSLLYLLLDDLPVAALVSGYAVSHGIDFTVPKEHRVNRQADLCAGWRSGGTLLTGLETEGRVPVSTGPDAPSLGRDDDPLAWHALPPIPEHGMRRHRRLDLTLDDAITVDAFFRDSHVAPGGRETVVHEYTVAARVDPDALAFTHVEATARTLPWAECNPAPASAARLVGRPLRDLRQHVRADFTGITTCTHLNDTLRSLEDVEALAAVLAGLVDSTR
ncbi:MAG: hypothetical protein DCC71_15675 [Proteobacteria bacterium]|nr:MAG: hypothetical protein DCC71_15675 [Pseudomonadota bacterium]